MLRRGASAREIETLYRRRFGALLLSVTAVLGDGDAAYDVVQESFARALERRGSFRDEGTLEAWIWRIAINAARDRFRRQRDFDVTDTRHDPPSTSHEELRAAVLALPERQRLAIFLRYYADLTYDDIAVALGVRTGTVAASLNAAHRTLGERLREEVTQ